MSKQGRRAYAESLTKEQVERMRMLHDKHGLTYEIIGKRFGISARTVRYHVGKLMKEAEGA